MKYATIENFLNVCERQGVPTPHAAMAFHELEAKYSEGHRAYHNLEHIDHLLGLFARLELPDDELHLAIWYHDAIYDPKAAHNERLSADYFLLRFSGYLWGQFSSEVERLIMATDPAQPRRGSNREDLMSDLDLSILSADPEKYRTYCEAIRKEYAHVADADFAEGRGQILRAFLAKPIYRTRYFRPREEKARSNVSNELEALQLQLG